VQRRQPREFLSGPQIEQIAAFLRDWLPEEAIHEYRRMIREDPANWWHDPHFENGLILRFALRGNGITERALGVADLSPLWPELLARAVAEDEPESHDGGAAP
jgi:hypothetical protein